MRIPFIVSPLPVVAIATVILSAPPLSARADTVLYDGSLGTLPSVQGFTFFGPGTTQTAPNLPTQPFTVLDTTASNSLQGGYTPNVALSLDRIAGYAVNVSARVVSETHATNDRAGFSIIALSSDKRGVELGFWTDRVWAQTDTPLFTHGEEALYNTTVQTAYSLAIQNNTYTLYANALPILSGGLRDYTAFAGFPDVYENPNFLFLGDDTTSAQARFELRSASVGAFPTVVPEAGTGLLMLIAVGMVGMLRYRNPRTLKGSDVSVPL